MQPCGDSLWSLWQLADSAFPTGGFAHSAGLEAAYQNGEVRNRADLEAFVHAGLEQAARAGLPFVCESFVGTTPLANLDELCEAFTSNHVANRASRLQGRALLNASRRAFSGLEVEAPTYCHLAPISGAIYRALGVERFTAIRVYLFTQVRGWISAAVRLNILGPLEAQRVQASVAVAAESYANGDYPLDSLAQTAPLLDIFQGGQDRLYTRLFQS